MTKNDENKAIEIIQEVKSNFGKDILLSYESKLYLSERLIDSYLSFLCDKKRKSGLVCLCTTGIDKRIDRSVRAICHILEDLDILTLSFEMKILDDEMLYDELKQKYSIEEERKYEAFKVLAKRTPYLRFSKRFNWDD